MRIISEDAIERNQSMKVMAESSEQIVELVGRGPIRARIWKAATEAGVRCYLYVTLIQVPEDQDLSQFERAFKRIPVLLARADHQTKPKKDAQASPNQNQTKPNQTKPIGTMGNGQSPRGISSE